MKMDSNLVSNKGTLIEIIDSKSNSTKNETPFVIVPGLSESAEDYIPLIQSLYPRRCIAISLRGRGKSDDPEVGYTLEDHISDIDAVIKHLKINELIIMGYSRGVSYTLGYALSNLNSIKGLVLGDYPAYHSQLPTNWVEQFTALPIWRGKPLPERMKIHSLYGIQRESKQVSFWDRLGNILCPVLIIRGGKTGSLLSPKDSNQYLERFPNSNLVVLEDSDHNIFEPNIENLLKELKEFFVLVES